jgi:hypothetical protein
VNRKLAAVSIGIFLIFAVPIVLICIPFKIIDSLMERILGELKDYMEAQR